MKKRDLVWIGLGMFLLISGVYIGAKVAQEEIRPLVVLSESMNPTLKIGDLVIFKKVSPEEVKIGDILVFKDPDQRKNVLITHRVVNQSKQGFQSKGDACEEPDQWIVKPEEVVGKPVLRIPYLGYLFGFRYLRGWQRLTLYIGLVIAPAALLIGDEIRKIFTNPLKLRKKERERKKVLKRKKRRKSIKI